MAAPGNPNDMLGKLAGLIAVEVKQKVDILEAVANTAGGCSCCEQANTYVVYDAKAPPEMKQAAGSQAHLFTITENKHGDISDICCRACCNPYHRMDLTVWDKQTQAPLFHINRPFKGCGCACFPCCLQEWQVLGADNTQILGFVTQSLFGGCFCPEFNLVEGPNKEAEPFELLRGPHCIGELCCSVMFKFTDPATKTEERGHATKMNAKSGMDALQECATDADNFELQMPAQGLPVHKAIQITSMVLLDYYFFEDGGAFQCQPLAAPGEVCCSLSLCTQYCCGFKQTWKATCNRPEPEEN